LHDKNEHVFVQIVAHGVNAELHCFSLAAQHSTLFYA